MVACWQWLPAMTVPPLVVLRAVCNATCEGTIAVMITRGANLIHYTREALNQIQCRK